MKYRIYLISFILTFAACTSLAAWFNYTVDPYGIFGSHFNFSRIKPKAAERLRVSKPYQVLRAKPVTLVVGNSRPEIGLDPQSPCWPDARKPVYNLALPGANLFQQYRYLQHAVSSGTVKHVLIGIDYQDFLVRPHGPKDFKKWAAWRRDYDSRLLVDEAFNTNSLYTFYKLGDYFTASYSLQTLADSVFTLISQNNPYASHQTPLGFNPASAYREIIRTEGQYVLFEQKNANVMRQFANKERGIFQNKANWSEDFESLHRMLKFLRQQRIAMTLFINPYHVDYLLAIQLNGRWQEYVQWQTRVIEVLEQNEISGLWDFNEISPITTEPPPQHGDTQTELKWFWEPSHHSRALGQAMLSRMLDRNCADITVGKIINSKNAAAHLQDIHSSLTQFGSENPLVLQRLKKYIELP